VIHKIAYGVVLLTAKSALVAGHALGHAWAEHSAYAALAAKASVAAASLYGVTVVTVAYLSKAEMEKQLLAAQGGVSSARTVKVGLGGKFINGEFTAITGRFQEGTDHVLAAICDEDTGSPITKVLLKANKVDSKLAKALSGGNVVVLA
jgi:hypothetical protein